MSHETSDHGLRRVVRTVALLNLAYFGIEFAGAPIIGIAKLRQVEILTSQGKSAVDAIQPIGVTDAIYYRWCQEYGGLKVDQVKRLKQLEAENARLRRAASNLTLEKLALKEAASGNF